MRKEMKKKIGYTRRKSNFGFSASTNQIQPLSSERTLLAQSPSPKSKNKPRGGVTFEEINLQNLGDATEGKRYQRMSTKGKVSKRNITVDSSEMGGIFENSEIMPSIEKFDRIGLHPGLKKYPDDLVDSVSEESVISYSSDMPSDLNSIPRSRKNSLKGGEEGIIIFNKK